LKPRPDHLAACDIVCIRCRFIGAPCLGCQRRQGKPFHGGPCEVYVCIASH